MSDEKQYGDRDIMGMDKTGNYFSRHMSAMTGERLEEKADIAAELAYRDQRIDLLQAQLDLRDRMLGEKNSNYNRVRADCNRVKAERDVAIQALTDVVHTVSYLKREADAEGTILSENVWGVANDPGVLRSIAEKVLSGDVNDILNLLHAQIRCREINDIIDQIGSDVEAAHVVVMLRSRLAEARNVPVGRGTSDLDTEIAEIRHQAHVSAVDSLISSIPENCKYITKANLVALWATTQPAQ